MRERESMREEGGGREGGIERDFAWGADARAWQPILWQAGWFYQVSVGQKKMGDLWVSKETSTGPQSCISLAEIR